MDLGKKFVQRIFLYSTMFVLIYSAYVVVAVLGFFRIIQLEIPLIVHGLALTDILLIFIVNMIMLNWGAEINEETMK